LPSKTIHRPAAANFFHPPREGAWWSARGGIGGYVFLKRRKAAKSAVLAAAA